MILTKEYEKLNTYVEPFLAYLGLERQEPSLAFLHELTKRIPLCL